MSTTLRRKMFKLGGPTNTHGIGITSGLDFNRKKFAKGGGNRDYLGETSMRSILPETGSPSIRQGWQQWMTNRAIQNSMLDQGFKPFGVQIAGNSEIQSANQRALADARRTFLEEGEAPPPVYWNDNYDRVYGFKKGGYVPQRVGHQPQDHPHRQGDREGHVGFLAPLIPFLAGAGTIGMRTLPAILRGLGSRSLKPIKDWIAGGKRPSARQIEMMKERIAKGGKGAETAAAELARTVGKYGFGPTGRMSQLARAGATGVGALAPVGLASSLAPELEKGKPGLGGGIQTAVQNLREIPELALDMAVGLPSGLLGALAGQGGAGFSPSRAIQDTLYPKENPKDQIESQEDAYEEMTEEGEAQAKEAIDEYYRLMSGQTKKQETLNLAGKVISGVAPQIDSGDYAGAAQEGANIMAQAADEKKAMMQQAAGVYLGEKMESDRLSDATVAELIAAGDVDGALEAERIMSAANDSGGMQNVQKLPVKANGKIATESLKAGVIYTDVSNATGGLYVVFAEDGEPIVTNSYTEARNAAAAAA